MYICIFVYVYMYIYVYIVYVKLKYSEDYYCSILQVDSMTWSLRETLEMQIFK